MLVFYTVTASFIIGYGYAKLRNYLNHHPQLFVNMKNINIGHVLLLGIALSSIGAIIGHCSEKKPFPPREKPNAHFYSTQERVELALKIPASNTQFFNVPAANIPSVVCDTTYTTTHKDTDGKSFAIVHYFDDHQSGPFDELGINTTEVQIFIDDDKNK